ncbi:MAG TPA: xanthine dehydrogenase accessory protein XdhC [Kofleriaceae bacterium]|nr:xanthine dehydrogenase accessory protein XdhC [Kofleriaceae bacterium]
MDLFARVIEAVDAGEDVAVATVIATSGSTPRHLGARMAVWADGRQAGTVGGGRIELETITTAREVAAGGAARAIEHHLVRDLAMCCGGSMTIAIAPARGARAAMAAVVAAARDRSWIALVTSSLGELSTRAPRDDERGRRPFALEGGALVEIHGPRDRAIVFGGGHVARALGPMLVSLGFEVVLADDGETGAASPSPAWAARVIDSFDPRDVERALGPLGAGDHVFIVTRDHAIDQQILEAVIANDRLSYLGLIGSRGKVGRFEKRLRAKGLADDPSWARLHAPIGLDLGAETPAEIAVAIAAELVALRHQRGTKP